MAYKFWLKTDNTSPVDGTGLIRVNSNGVFIKRRSGTSGVNVGSSNYVTPTQSNLASKFPAGVQSTFRDRLNYTASANISYMKGNIDNGSTIFGPF